MKRIYIKIGDSVPTDDGIAVCTEPPNEEVACCKLCCFDDVLCTAFACDPEERPDGKNVIFIEKKGGEE